jgi:3-hydroxyisobutyrate dehydrogenase-like beta-hydroxyacid dehydrogenase
MIGLGLMGTALTDRLLDAGYTVWVHNWTREKAEPLVARGARWAGEPAGRLRAGTDQPVHDGHRRRAALQVLMNSMAHSRIMDTKGRKMVEGDFRTQARLSQHLKDIRLILAAATSAGAGPAVDRDSPTVTRSGRGRRIRRCR